MLIVLLVVGAKRDHIEVHDGKASFKRFYTVQNSSSTRKPWTLQVNTRTFGKDFISFFATDIDRYSTLEYSSMFWGDFLWCRVLRRAFGAWSTHVYVQ